MHLKGEVTLVDGDDHDGDDHDGDGHSSVMKNLSCGSNWYLTIVLPASWLAGRLNLYCCCDPPYFISA